MKNDGGPVHQMQVKDKGVYVMQPGLTIRDWFAGQALIALSAKEYDLFSHLAIDAYKVADAMLAERTKES